jgi:glycosyltransferase involved in cell wall biosynthesis
VAFSFRAASPATAERAQRKSGELKTISILLCTRDRPELLTECLASCAKLIHPPGLEVRVCVADNNDIAHEQEILQTARSLGLSIDYGHEPRRGYASARNCALRLAIATHADLAIFMDDDSRADPRLVIEHVSAIERYRADAVLGRIEGLSRRPREGRRVYMAGTGNISVRRWIYAPKPEGIGLRFDQRLDLLGQEDREFFAEVIRNGGVIRQSCLPLVLNSEAQEANPTSSEREFCDRLTFAKMEGRNEVVVARLRHGWGKAVARLALRQTPQLQRGISDAVLAIAVRSVDAARSKAKMEEARVRLAKVGAAISGFWRPGFERQAARNGKLVEVDNSSKPENDV